MKCFARKIGMSHIYDKNGEHQAVTVLELKKTVLAKQKTVDKNGYSANLYILAVENFKSPKSLSNQFKNISGVKKVVEEKVSELKNGDFPKDIKVDDFKEGDKIMIQSKSKGKGFAGTVKRHGFTTGPKTHGSNSYRRPGSIGATYPQRTVKGKKMSGHMGAKSVSLKNLNIVRVDSGLNRIWVKGSIPGPNKSEIIITKHD